jgi:hypothetical protein
MPVPEADMTANAGAPDPMGADPEIGAGIGNMAEDPNAGMPTEDPEMEGDGMGMEGGEADGDDSTASIIDQLSDDDKEAVRNYAKSLLNRDEAQPEDMAGAEEPAAAPTPDQGGQGVMMEITKGRLKKVQQRLHETFRSQEEDEDETDRKQKKVKKNVGKKSPFDSPLD